MLAGAPAPDGSEGNPRSLVSSTVPERAVTLLDATSASTCAGVLPGRLTDAFATAGTATATPATATTATTAGAHLSHTFDIEPTYLSHGMFLR